MYISLRVFIPVSIEMTSCSWPAMIQLRSSAKSLSVSSVAFGWWNRPDQKSVLTLAEQCQNICEWGQTWGHEFDSPEPTRWEEKTNSCRLSSNLHSSEYACIYTHVHLQEHIQTHKHTYTNAYVYICLFVGYLLMKCLSYRRLPFFLVAHQKW